MPRMLHITNGDSVSLRETALGGEVVAWQDVLHEGPVPAGLTLEELRPVRARLLAKLSSRPESLILAQLEKRDRALVNFQDWDEVVLWFEHDLYDQLQLIQILNWFAGRDPGRTPLYLINVDHYLGPMRPAELLALYPNRARVTSAQTELASRAWSAFSSPDPRLLTCLIEEPTSELPYLAGALERHLEQFPSVENGLSRTERQILEITASGVTQSGAIFRADRDREERVFMGDLVFSTYIQGLANARVPLLHFVDPKSPFWEGSVEVTQEGCAVLRGEADHIELNGIDRWLGGVHLQGANLWRWNGKHRSFSS
jgi:hypothetical protein